MNIRKLLFNLTHWETWHHHAKYIPLMPVWLWYCFRARSMWFFTAADPSLTFGGFEGETKEEMYNQLPEGSYPKTLYIEPGVNINELKNTISLHGFTYPFVVKPDIGMMGLMFRMVYNESQLKQYHAKMPVKYLIQKWVAYRHEYAVFYYRMPNSNQGTISGFLSKSAPQIVGDGVSNLATLIEANPDLKFKIEEMQAKHKTALDHVLPAGELYILSQASNRSQGGKLTNLSSEIDEQLTRVFDEISLHTKHFYYGRYDIKCDSVADLKAGKNFSILEFNGTGAGVQHVYGDNLSLYKACRIILDHWKQLYKISMMNHKTGIPFWTYQKGKQFLKEAKKNLRQLKKLDADLPEFSSES